MNDPSISKQKPKSNNPLSLVIGQKVKIYAISKVDYIEKQKQVIKRNVEKETYVIGTVKKALGEYVSGHHYGLDDYETPSLRVSHYIWLYQTRETLSSPILLVSSEDIKI